MQYVESAGAQNAPAFSLFRNPLASGFLTAALLVLAYPKFNLSALAWAAFIPFTFGLPALSGYRRAALYGLYTGFVFYAGILYWIVPTCRAGGLNPVLAAGAWLLLALIMACEWAVFSAGVYFFRNAGLLFPLSAALCWTVAEWFKILLAQNAVWFPWFMLGYTQWAQERFIQAASLGGVYLTGFAVVFTGFCAGYAWREKLSFKKTVLVCLPAVVLASAMWGYGYWRLGRISSGGSKISAAALQPNIEQYRKWDAAFEGFICGRLAAQIGTVSVKKPEKLDLVVWPESALPGWLDEARYAALASSAAVRTGAPQLVGAALSSRRQYVSAYLIERYGITGFYDKRELVPFGEYVPLRSVLGKYVGVVNQLGEFVPGRYDSPLMRAGDISVGEGICYEAIFPYLWRERAGRGAKLFVNITNDGWYLDTAAPYQHFISNVFRAVENGVPLLRSANTGLSGYIDAYGRVRSVTRLGAETVLFAEMEPALPGYTFYSRSGDFFAFVCAVFLAALGLRIWRKKLRA